MPRVPTVCLQGAAAASNVQKASTRSVSVAAVPRAVASAESLPCVEVEATQQEVENVSAGPVVADMETILQERDACGVSMRSGC